MSWLCARNPEHTDHGTYKVNKVSLLHANGSYSPIKFYTEQGKADNIWKRDNYCNLEKLIVQSSGEILKKIAELVGYKEEIK